MGNCYLSRKNLQRGLQRKAIVSEAREVCAVVCEWRSDEEECAIRAGYKNPSVRVF